MPVLGLKVWNQYLILILPENTEVKYLPTYYTIQFTKLLIEVLMAMLFCTVWLVMVEVDLMYWVGGVFGQLEVLLSCLVVLADRILE